MLSKRKVWLERATNWAIALAVPLVAIGGFKLLAHARDGARPLPGPDGPPGRAAASAAPGRVLSVPIDASAPPVVELRAASPATSGEDPRCTALARVIRDSDSRARLPGESGAPAQPGERGQAARAEARTLRCRPP